MSCVEQSVARICCATASELSIRHSKGNEVHKPSSCKRLVHDAVSVKTLRLYNASNNDNADIRAQATNRVNTLYNRFARVHHRIHEYNMLLVFKMMKL